MIQEKKIAVVLPAYNAEKTLEKTSAALDRSVVDDIILVDDCSWDRTVEVARDLGLRVICHERNKGYGGNQKTCYRAALDRGADIVIMVHPDYQYAPELVPAMGWLIASGLFDVVLGSRILGTGALEGGMPRYKYLANRLLTAFQNILMGHKLSEYHTGYRAFSRKVLETLPLEENSNDFVFDNQMLAQAVYFGLRIGEVTCPTRYTAESSSISFARSVRYGLGVLRDRGSLPDGQARVASFLHFFARRPKTHTYAGTQPINRWKRQIARSAAPGAGPIIFCRPLQENPSFPTCAARACGLVFLSPRPEAAEMQGFYGEDYYGGEDRKFRSGAGGPAPPFGPGEGAPGSPRYFPSPGKVLDVGCGQGAFLQLDAGKGLEGARDRAVSPERGPGPSGGALRFRGRNPGIVLQRRFDF
jgi:hypothetical protein